ncbi:MAG: DsbC family protein [Dokdonella sp.]
MPRIFVPLLAASLLALAPVYAAAADAARAAIQKVAPLQRIAGFRESALPGYFEGVIDGAVVYASADGRFVIRGQVDDTETGTSLTEASMAERRVETLATLGPELRLSYAPPAPKYRLTVFTDVDCPYCKRLHARINEYLELGIAIDYVFFPLSIHVGAERKSVHVWCSADRVRAYDAIMAGQKLPPRSCDHPLARMMEAGNAIGVNATPTAIGPDGRVFAPAVLMSPQRLFESLELPSAVDAIADEPPYSR